MSVRRDIDRACSGVVAALALALALAALGVASRAARGENFLTVALPSAELKSERAHSQRVVGARHKARRGSAVAAGRPARAGRQSSRWSPARVVSDSFARVRGQPLRDARPLPVRAVKTISVKP